MKRVAALLLLLGLAGCGKYPSSQRALEACNEWEEQGEVIRYKLAGKDGITHNLFNRNRTCYNAFWDNQYEGIYGEFDDADRRKEGKLLEESDEPTVKGRNKIYFRY
ncbi:hypothetical protein [Synechococcus sp. UW140]|uniref:hypothetical protein n=1 Tax=Synechococcus sp. UW140 TaxID=368503 RepID=UPI0010BD5F46|nr:hypothetical protein [Synechococcus sp. UW140]